MKKLQLDELGQNVSLPGIFGTYGNLVPKASKEPKKKVPKVFFKRTKSLKRFVLFCRVHF